MVSKDFKSGKGKECTVDSFSSIRYVSRDPVPFTSALASSYIQITTHLI
jgi:hypothetical protein